MKNRSLAFQIWFIMTAFVMFVSVILVLTVSITVNTYFQNITLKDVKASQIEEMGRGNLSSLDSRLEAALTVSSSDIKKHILINREELKDLDVLSNMEKTVAQDILRQEASYGEYARSYGTLKLFYIVKNFLYNSKPYSLVTFYWDKEQNRIIVNLIKNVITVISISIVINVTLAQLISRGLTAPIRYMEKKVSEIARKEWDTDIELDRKDELGRLAASINIMKDSLKKKDLEEQTFIQTISHDLKTPLMIIRSYSQALLDKIYVNNSFEDTVRVIERETMRLETKVEQLLYLYSFDYIMNNIKEYEEMNLEQTISSMAKEMSLCHKDIEIKAEVPDISISGSPADLTQAFENILENNLRYAKSCIWIKGRETALEREGEQIQAVELDFFNDGVPIDNTVIKNLFNKYQKGKNGKFGLGLFISKKIIEHHKGEIRAENLKEGVIFRITLPISQ
ncbi:MAG TPA: HAMP domain-containing sensor histidine kinase [Negativicutes bacterium]|nr:HAMP domain-containing sensor histidine kinase [Negativicutes bacterium]